MILAIRSSSSSGIFRGDTFPRLLWTRALAPSPFCLCQQGPDLTVCDAQDLAGIDRRDQSVHNLVKNPQPLCVPLFQRDRLLFHSALLVRKENLTPVL
jgi:hypothetical protein